MAKLNRTCIVCGRKYEYCSSCKEHATLEPWHSIFCSDNCRKIFNAVSMYGKDSNEDIKEKLDKCDLSNKANFHKNIVKVIDELYTSEQKVKVVPEELIVETIKEDVVETVEVSNDVVEKTENEEAVEAESVETIEQTENVELPKMTYKGRKRK